MKLLNHIFGKKTPTSLAIAAEIEKARAEHTAAVAERGAALAGLSIMSDAEHIKAEAEYQAQRRAADRAEARVADLEKAHAEALAVEAEAERQAESDVSASVSRLRVMRLRSTALGFSRNTINTPPRSRMCSPALTLSTRK
jgi:hypothetical protein